MQISYDYDFIRTKHYAAITDCILLSCGAMLPSVINEAVMKVLNKVILFEKYKQFH